MRPKQILKAIPHGSILLIERNQSGSPESAGFNSAGVCGFEIAGASEHVGGHAGQENDQADDGCDGCGVVSGHAAQPRPIWDRMP